MIQVISAHLRRTAEFFMFSATLGKEKLYDIFDNLRDTIKDKSLFEPDAGRGDPLTFSKKGIAKVRSFGIPTSEGMTFRDLIKRIDSAISLAAKSEGELDMKNLDTYLSGAFRNNLNRWYNVTYKGKAYDLARDEALSKVIEPAITALEATAKVLERKGAFQAENERAAQVGAKKLLPLLKKLKEQLSTSADSKSVKKTLDECTDIVLSPGPGFVKPNSLRDPFPASTGMGRNIIHLQETFSEEESFRKGALKVMDDSINYLKKYYKLS